MYDKRLIYWDNTLRSDVPFKRFINALGIEYKTLEEADYKGADYVYLKLDTSKYQFTAPTVDEITTKLNNTFNVDDEFELYIHYTGESKRVADSHWSLTEGMDPTKISSYTIDTAAIRATLHSDPMKYFANADLSSTGKLLVQSNTALSIIQTGANTSPSSTPITSVGYSDHIYSTLSLLDNGSMFTQVGDVYDEISTVNQTTNSNVYFTYSYKLKFKVANTAINTSYIVTQIKSLADIIQTASEYTGNEIFAISNIADDTTLKQAVISMVNPDIVGLTYNGYLRVDAVANMKRKEFSNMMGKILSSGYEEEDAEWYEVIFSVVLIVLSIVIGVLSAGGLSVVSTQLAAAATALAITSVSLTVSLVVYANVFPYAMDMIKLIGKFAQIVGALASITGIMSAIQTAWNKAAQAAVEKKVISDVSQYTVTQFVKDMIINFYDKITASIMDKISFITDPSKWSLSSLSEITLSDVSGWLNNLGDGFKTYMKFFGDSKQYNTLTEEEQAAKENGVEHIYLTYEMIYNNDALYRIDNLVKNNSGGQKTENFLIQIA